MDNNAALDLARGHLQASAEVKLLMSQTLCEPIVRAALAMAQALAAGHKLMFCGNGGSAADAQHLAAELVGRFNPTSYRPPLAALALTTDSSALTALGNDFGFDEVFARQVEALGHPDDMLVAISTSGNSGNIIRAVETAKRHGLLVVGLSGQSGRLPEVADYAISVPSSETPRIQEGHIAIGHCLCDLIERFLLAARPGQDEWVVLTASDGHRNGELSSARGGGRGAF